MEAPVKRYYVWRFGEYCVELGLLRRYASFTRSLVLCEGECSLLYDRSWDHSPRFDLRLTLLNCTLVELSIFNRNHAEDSK